jgi:hypothetical protein
MKISGPMPPTAAPLPEPWANAGEMSKSISPHAARNNIRTSIKRFIGFTIYQPI